MDVIILGAGISGLATAWQLRRKGYDVFVIEKHSEAGGSMVSRREEGYLIDFGPNSGLETTPLIKELLSDAGAAERMQYANAAASNRYILRNNQLYPLPTGPGAFFKTGLFSISAKLRLMAEPFIGKSDDGYYQSISQFVKRRLGSEFLDYAINPFVAGIFAGDPDELSVKSAFPKLYRLEEVYGGLIKGMIKGAKERKQSAEKSKQNARMFAFEDGMQGFPMALAGGLKGHIVYNTEVTGISRENGGYIVECTSTEGVSTYNAPVVISTLPAYTMSGLMKEYDPVLSGHLKSIYYPPVKVLYLGYRKEDIGRDIDGFGFLIPQKERKLFLGALWSSAIFPGRAPEGYESFTLFIGGARSPEMVEVESDLLNEMVINEFSNIMKIESPPVFLREKTWAKAIPQYNIGYIEHERYFEEFEQNNRGFILSGNYRGGISVGDCVKNSAAVVDKVSEKV